jgi:head-tail adaptor
VPPRVHFRAADWKDRVHVQRTSYIVDDAGGNLTATVTIARNIPCVVASQGMTEANAIQRQGAQETHTVTFKADPAVRNGDRLLYTGRLFVVKTSKNEFNLGVIWTVTCTEQVA